MTRVNAPRQVVIRAVTMRDCDSAILCNAETGLCDPRSGKGGAVYITDAAVTFENVVMKGNYAERKGGAIYVLNSALWLFDTAVCHGTRARVTIHDIIQRV